MHILESERGANWEIWRKFVSADEAETIGSQVMHLIDLDRAYIREFGPEGNGSDYKTFMVDTWSMKKYPNHPDTLYNDPEVMADIPDLVAMHRRVGKILKDGKSFQINQYFTDGKSRTHRDRRDDDTCAVGLIGVAGLRIKDPATGVVHELEIDPGDAVYFVNPRLQRFRPLHQFFNLEDGQRLSFVE